MTGDCRRNGSNHGSLITLRHESLCIQPHRPAPAASMTVMMSEASRQAAVPQVIAETQEASGSSNSTEASSFARVDTGNVTMSCIMGLAARHESESAPESLMHPASGIATTILMPSSVVAEQFGMQAFSTLASQTLTAKKPPFFARVSFPCSGTSK